MNQIGFPSGFVGFNQFHQVSNPTSQVAAAPQYVAAPMPMAVAAYPMAMMPAYMMAQPQMAGMMPMSASGAAMGGTQGGGHVTQNPTNATPGEYGAGAAGMGMGMGGFYGMPMMISPVFMAMGFPMMAFAPQQGGGEVIDAPAAPSDVVADVPAADVPAVDAEIITEAPEQPIPSTDGAVVDVVPEDTENPSLPSLPITELSAAEFDKYRFKETELKSETSLSMSLTTLDGDVISLDFSQMDIQSSEKFAGKTLDGSRVRDMSYFEDSERLVNMEVTGELSEAERAAIDGVLGTVMDVVQRFFSGDMEGAVAKLKMMDFDSSELAELSLQMSMSKSAEINRGYHDGMDKLHQLANKDAEIGNALEFLANEQKRLVDLASNVLETPSAVKLVKSLLPPLLSEPFAALQEEVMAAPSEVPASDEAADAAEVTEGVVAAMPSDVAAVATPTESEVEMPVLPPKVAKALDVIEKISDAVKSEVMEQVDYAKEKQS